MKHGIVPLYQKVMIEKAVVEQVVGQLQFMINYVEVTYNYVRSDGVTLPLIIQDICDIESLVQCIKTSQLWMSRSESIWINCKDYVVSLEFDKALIPVYIFVHKSELEDALDVILEPLFA